MANSQNISAFQCYGTFPLCLVHVFIMLRLLAMPELYLVFRSTIPVDFRAKFGGCLISREMHCILIATDLFIYYMYCFNALSSVTVTLGWNKITTLKKEQKHWASCLRSPKKKKNQLKVDQISFLSLYVFHLCVCVLLNSKTVLQTICAQTLQLPIICSTLYMYVLMLISLSLSHTHTHTHTHTHM